MCVCLRVKKKGRQSVDAHMWRVGLWKEHVENLG